MSKAIAPDGKMVDQEDFNLEGAKKNCPTCYGRGIQGKWIGNNARFDLPIICHCVNRKEPIFKNIPTNNNKGKGVDP